ncbi:MAG: alpha-amylase, partial [Acidocella sp.]|nr:alpha-amylase [Acidocella sp.]
HLGQVLVTPMRETVIVDFEGEPDRSLDARRARSNPLRDVAGMVRSFEYLAATAVRRGIDAGVMPVLIASFRQAYAARLSETVHAATTMSCTNALFELFWIEKAAYEVAYEAEHRPDWLSIPLSALVGVARRMAPL